MDAWRMFEAWYEQRLFGNTLSLRLGLYDYHAEFYALDTAKLFLNASFGVGPELAQIGPSIFPTTSLALRVKYQPTSQWYALATVYDGVPGDPGNPRMSWALPWRMRAIVRLSCGPNLPTPRGLKQPWNGRIVLQFSRGYGCNRTSSMSSTPGRMQHCAMPWPLRYASS